MAKKKINVTNSQADAAEPTFTAFLSAKLNRMGAAGGAKRFRGDGPLRRRQARKWLQKYADDGGDVGDFQSFMEWLIAHADEIIAFISKLIALFSV